MFWWVMGARGSAFRAILFMGGFIENTIHLLSGLLELG